MKNRKVKSNRAQADYFELLVCQYICHLYNITFSYSRDLAELSNKILSLPSGTARLKLQNDNFIKIQPKIKEILDYEIGQKGKVINVIWVGRNLLIETTSDVDAEHISRQKTRFSIKSIANTGTGTLKNLGARQIKKYLGIDFSNDYKQMWEELRKYLSDPTSSQDQIKKRVQKNQKLLKWATENGKKYQIVLNELCFNSFNSLPLNQKINFLNFITDCDDDDLYVIIVNSTDVIIYKPVEKNLKLIKNIEARKDKMTDVGYTIFVDDKPTYRVQTNNTNGIGISAFCQRIFWV
jgi:succinate dehydrogenase flavin-adding protein (antitoxin of CptAB toxin-antitoxin module)